MYTVLVVDDETPSRVGLKSLLARWGYKVDEAAGGQQALDKIRELRPDAVITDLVMPGLDGLELLRNIHDELAFTSVIILTGHGTIDTAVSAIKEGAYDYLTKPVDIDRLRVMLERALDKTETVREVATLRRRLRHHWGFGKLVGKSPAMQEVYRMIELAAPTSSRVLILGESGTGKELVAQSLHELSPRKNGPFIAVNCAAIPETLLESEIFGHEKGAFTGALDRRAGCFELAHNGTVFLDEIAEMKVLLQVKLLRVLQDSVVKRVGGTNELTVDVRVVAATNRDPLQAIQDGKLREDLFYRLQVLPIHLPPLRDRKDDIPLLAQTFLDEFNARYQRHVLALDDPALRVLQHYHWPGNVRELRNAIERAVLVCDSDLISPSHLPPTLTAEKETEPSDAVRIPLGISLEEAEKRIILTTLTTTNNNKTKTAEILGISLKTLHNKLDRYGLRGAPDR